MKKTIIITAVLFLTLPAIAEFNNTQKGYYDARTYTRGKITKIVQRQIDTGQGQKLTETIIHFKIMEGEFKDAVKKAIFKGEDDLPRDMHYREGDTYFIGISQMGDENTTEYVSIYDVDNTITIIIMVFLMVLVIVLVGRIKGFASLIALAITILLLFLVLIPLTLRGFPPLPITICIAIISVVITMPIIAGINIKTASAILGASGGIILSSLLAIIAGWIMHLSGLVTNEMLTIFYLTDVNIDLRGIVLSGMIIAALGAIMDVCISIASSVNEIYTVHPDISTRDAFRSALNIGRDILGSMVNTLILAYVGSSLSLILLITLKLQPEMSFWMVLSYNPVMSEIVKSVIGSIGMFVSIPLTAIISVKMNQRKLERDKL